MKNQLILFLSMLIVNTGLAQMPSKKLIATVLGKFEGIVSKQELIDKGKIEIVSKNKNRYKVIGFKYLATQKGFKTLK